jgi:ABC-type Mn2+/Zn2+ transport system permease subunit
VDVADALLDPWRSGIDRRALIEVILLGAFCGGLGFWVVTERLSYGAESLAHGLLPGLVLAALAGAPLLLGAGGGVAVAAVLIALASRDEHIGPDTAVAVAVTGLLGLGALLALSPDAPQRLQELLFGDPLGVSDSDLVAAAVLAVVGGAALTVLHRPLTATAFGAGDAAAAPGVRPAVVSLALLGLLAAAVAIAVQGLGALLVLAVLVAPPVAVRGWSVSAAGAIRAGALVGALAGVAGVYLSVQAGTAAGASIALALCAAALAGSGVTALRGSSS